MSSALVLVVLNNLRDLGEQVDGDGGSLQDEKKVPGDPGGGNDGSIVLGDASAATEDVAKEQERGENHKRTNVLARVMEHEPEDDQVLDGDKEGLAIGGDGVVLTDVVGQGDDTGEGLKHVRGDGDTFGGAGLDNLDDLRHLDDGTASDDTEAEALGNCILDAVDIVVVEIFDEGAVAGITNDGDGGRLEEERELHRG